MEPPSRPFGFDALIEVLHSLACYNDKGFEWSGHTPEESDQLREKYQVQIASLFNAIGEQNLPPSLLEAFRTGDLLTDWSGNYAEELETWPAQ